MSVTHITRVHPQAQTSLSVSHGTNGNTSVSKSITLIGRHNNRADDVVHDVNTFTTGLVFTVPSDGYLLVTAHPSLLSLGYMMPAPLIVDASNTDELVIPLYKFKDGEDLELPFEAVQFTFCSNPTNYVSLSSSNTGTTVSNNSSIGGNNYKTLARPGTKNTTYMT